jgi:cytoskeletal protein CcmA (bactofilin family)
VVNGDIATDSLEIELGAQYNGKLNMRRPQMVQASEEESPSKKAS